MGETPGKNGAGRRASVFSGPDRLKAGRRTRFVAWVERERERLAQEFLELKYDSKSVTEITRMFTERVMFSLEFALEQAQMSRYLRMLKRDTRQFVSTQRSDTLLELQVAARRRELEMELQLREQTQAPV